MMRLLLGCCYAVVTRCNANVMLLLCHRVRLLLGCCCVLDLFALELLVKAEAVEIQVSVEYCSSAQQP